MIELAVGTVKVRLEIFGRYMIHVIRRTHNSRIEK